MELIDAWTTCSANRIQLDRQHMEILERYHNDLRYWNEKVNMVSRKDIDQLWERHILHSLMLLKYAEFKPKARVLDIGTGGGLPGIPLKIARPDLRVTLVDSIAKKMKLVEMFAKHTEFKDLIPVTARVETLCDDPHYRGQFDVIVSRAVARTSQLISWSRPLLAPSGFYALLKGGDLQDELEEARQDHPDAEIIETPILAVGLPWFTTDAKKVITCRFS